MRTLYGYFRSSASYRVRMALNWKQLTYDTKSVHLVKDGGEQHHAAYRALNRQSLVPTLVDGDFVLSQSLAILQYLEMKYSETPLVSGDIEIAARTWQIAQLIACDVHPLNNLSVLQYLSQTLQCDDQQKQAWYQHWIAKGFSAVEALLNDWQSDSFVIAEQFSVADCCLVPQVYNALRFKCDMGDYPRIMQIYEQCLTLPAVIAASPEQQADFA